MPVLAPARSPSRRRRDYHPLWQLTLARFREFLREPDAVFWTFFFPILLAVALGLAFRNRGEDPVYVALLRQPGADSIARLLERTPGLHARVLPADSAALALRRGSVALVIGRQDGRYTFRYDPSRPESRIARLVSEDALQRAAGRTDPVATTAEQVREPGSRYIDFLIPGLIGFNLLSTGLWGVGFTVVQMRKEQLLKRLFSTPLRRPHFLLSFMFARLFFLAAELALVLSFAYLVFHVPVRGSLFAFAFLAVLGAFCFTSLGLLIASRSRTLEGVQGLMNLASLPMWVLSGVFFSTERFPALMQPLIAALPLTACVDALRAVMIDGAALLSQAGEIGVLAAWGVVCLGIALPIFRWR
ncbi:MAG: ABC transporter permease [Gemmatimonadetes bacterium]|nr:ABC transporter permease [Gemmatimonadota bacterium]